MPIIPKPSVKVRLEHPPSRLALTVTRADGSKRRWGPGGDVADIPAGITFTTKDPGGFAEFSTRLGRDVFEEYPDLNRFDDVLLYGPGRRVAWNGRMTRFPRESASRSIQPAAVGYSAHLRDDSGVREVYADRDFARWGPIILGRRISLLPGWILNDPQTVVDPASQSSVLETGMTGAWSEHSAAEASYSAGVPIGSLYYSWVREGSVDNADSNWSWAAFLSPDGVSSFPDTTGDLRAAGPGTGTLNATTGDRMFALLALYFAVAGGADGLLYAIHWRPVVYGTHGLPLQGGAGGGIYGHDILRDLVTRWAPLLDPSGIEPDTSFVMPHFVAGLDGPATAEDAALQLNAFYLKSWGVYENRKLFWRPTDTVPRIWHARRSEGALLRLEGKQSDDDFNGVLGFFTDPTGKARSVGPPGARTDFQDATLQDTSPDNPVNAHGIPRRWGKLQIQQVTTPEGAIQVCARWLAESFKKNQQGELEVVRDIEDDSGARLPVWAMRAGDWVRVKDGDSTLRRIVQTTYTHDQLRNVCQLDVPASRLDALLERMGVVLVGVLG